MDGSSILLLVIATVAWVVVSEDVKNHVWSCANTCNCTQKDMSGTVVNCAGQKFSDFPENLPPNTTEL